MHRCGPALRWRAAEALRERESGSPRSAPRARQDSASCPERAPRGRSPCADRSRPRHVRSGAHAASRRGSLRLSPDCFRRGLAAARNPASLTLGMGRGLVDLNAARSEHDAVRRGCLLLGEEPVPEVLLDAMELALERIAVAASACELSGDHVAGVEAVGALRLEDLRKRTAGVADRSAE